MILALELKFPRVHDKFSAGCVSVLPFSQLCTCYPCGNLKELANMCFSITIRLLENTSGLIISLLCLSG